jgi:alcohol dehydrogenase, propanol-preferring
MQTDESLCDKVLLSGYTVDGTFQQYCVSKAAHVAYIPKELDLADMAPVLCAGITVYKGLKESGAKSGQTVAIVGAGGGLGVMAQITSYYPLFRTTSNVFSAICESDESPDDCHRYW